MGRRPRGLSLLEVLVVLSLLGLMLALGLSQFRGSRQRTATRGAADMVASELRAARSLAQTRGYPVAVSFPPGESALCGKGLYVLAGATQPTVTQRWDASSEFPGLEICAGFWSPRARPLPLEVDLRRWQAPRPQDPTIVFTSSGSASANFPAEDGGYAVMLGRHLGAERVSQDGQPALRLVEGGDLVTVLVGFSGQVTIRPGFPGPEQVRSLAAHARGSEASFSLPALPAPAPTAPSDLQVEAFPRPVPETLPPGIDAVVSKEGTLTLTLTCSAQGGGRLSSRWICEQGGGLSTVTPVEMQWNGRRWESVLEWGPPADAVPDQVYLLSCEVSDDSGGRATARLGASGRVQILPKGALAFTSTRGGSPDVFSCDVDGTDLRQLTRDGAAETMLSWTRDGSKLVYTSDVSGQPEIWIMEGDGSSKRQLTDGPSMGLQEAGWPAPDATGCRVAFLGKRAGRHGVYLITTEGTHPDNPSLRQPKFLGGDWSDGAFGGGRPTSRGLSWCPLGDTLVVGGGDLTRAQARELIEVPADGSGNLVSLLSVPPNSYCAEPSFSPDGSRLVYHQPGRIVLAGYQPGRLVTQRSLMVDCPQSPRFSPDGSRLTSQGNSAGALAIFTLNLDGTGVRQITPDGLGNHDGSCWTLR